MGKGKTIKPLNTVTHEMGKHFLTLLVVSLLPCFLMQAHAAGNVQLNLSATIEKSCAIDRTGADAGNGSDPASPEEITLDSNGSITIPLTIDCNTPFTYSITSGNGALVHTGGQNVASNSDSILTVLPYKTTFTSNLEDGATANMTQTCGSEDLADATPNCDGSTFINSGTAVAINEDASLTIALDGTTYSDGKLDGTPILAGTFQDRLTLTVSIHP